MSKNLTVEDVIIDFGKEIQNGNPEKAVFYPFRPKSGFLLISDSYMQLEGAARDYVEAIEEVPNIKDKAFLMAMGKDDKLRVVAGYLVGNLSMAVMQMMFDPGTAGVWDAENDKVISREDAVKILKSKK